MGPLCAEVSFLSLGRTGTSLRRGLYSPLGAREASIPEVIPVIPSYFLLFLLFLVIPVYIPTSLV